MKMGIMCTDSSSQLLGVLMAASDLELVLPV